MAARVSLDDKYGLDRGCVFISGQSQALPEAMTHIQRSVKSASRSSLSASELGSEVGRNF